MAQQNDSDALTPEMRAADKIAQEIISKNCVGELEVDVVNACMRVIQLILNNSEDITFGEEVAGNLMALGAQVMKVSVQRQLLSGGVNYPARLN